MKTRQTILFLALLCVAILACNLPFSLPVTQRPITITPLIRQIPSKTPALSPEPPFTETFQPTSTTPFTGTPPPIPTHTPTPTPIPTYQILRGEVIADNVVCHYGPGADYLYKYGLVAGSHLEILGRIAQGKYIEVQAVGGNNPCWVNPDWMRISSDPSNLRPISADDTGLPFTRRYKPPAGISALRDGSSVTVSWAPVILSPGDDSGAPPYLIEAWVCQGGQVVFSPTGWRQTRATIADESGCDSPSHARLYAVEKHGYTLWIEIPWPSYPK